MVSCFVISFWGEWNYGWVFRVVLKFQFYVLATNGHMVDYLINLGNN